MYKKREDGLNKKRQNFGHRVVRVRFIDRSKRASLRISDVLEDYGRPPTRISLRSMIRPLIISKGVTGSGVSILTIRMWIFLQLSTRVSLPWEKPLHSPHFFSKNRVSGVVTSIQLESHTELR